MKTSPPPFSRSRMKPSPPKNPVPSRFQTARPKKLRGAFRRRFHSHRRRRERHNVSRARLPADRVRRVVADDDEQHERAGGEGEGEERERQGVERDTENEGREAHEGEAGDESDEFHGGRSVNGFCVAPKTRGSAKSYSAPWKFRTNGSLGGMNGRPWNARGGKISRAT